MSHISNNITLAYMCVILLCAILAMLVTKLKQPTVLGQLLIGIVISFIAHYKITFFLELIHNQTMSFLAEVGSIFLLFEIGLESSIHEIQTAGRHAVIVAITGVIIPFAMGFYLLTPLISTSHNLEFALFIGSILTVTSTGISVSVFKDIGILKQTAAQIVLTASIIDDIIGLILLSIINGLISVGQIDVQYILLTLLYIIIFFVVSFILGKVILPFLVNKIISKISSSVEMQLLLLTAIAMVFSLVASSIGLATIIGAFIAGLIIEEHTFVSFSATTKLETLIAPLGKIFIPIFFIYAGMQVDIIAALNLETLKLALIISIFAIVSKAVCGIFLPTHINKWIVGFGMVSRGEIGIIFALSGIKFHLISNNLFTALLLMILITSIITPIMLNYLNKNNSN